MWPGVFSGIPAPGFQRKRTAALDGSSRGQSRSAVCPTAMREEARVRTPQEFIPTRACTYADLPGDGFFSDFADTHGTVERDALLFGKHKPDAIDKRARGERNTLSCTLRANRRAKITMSRCHVYPLLDLSLFGRGSFSHALQPPSPTDTPGVIFGARYLTESSVLSSLSREIFTFRDFLQ